MKIIKLALLLFISLIGVSNSFSQDTLFVSGTHISIRQPGKSIILNNFKYEVVDSDNSLYVREANNIVYKQNLSLIYMGAGIDTNQKKIKYLSQGGSSYFTTISITSQIVIPAYTYKEVSITPVAGSSYGIQNDSQTPVTQISSIANYISNGFISNSITVTPSAGSTIIIGMKR